MHPRRLPIVILALLLPAILLVQAAWSQGGRLPLKHPDEDGNLGRCSTCHVTENGGFPFRRYEHTPLFGESHSLQAVNSKQVCAMCHRPSFCSDCHSARAALKPSLKNHGDTRRLMPHRGNYLTRHRIDGRLNPAKCFRCHGRPKAQKSCMRCHR